MSPPFAILLAEQALHQFVKQWKAGLQPCLLLETHTNGAIFVSSKVTAGVTLPQQTENVFSPQPDARHHPRRQHRRPPGPSRLRRRERRAQARELAAVQAVPTFPNFPNKPEAAVEAAAPSSPVICEAAVQAVPSPARAVASVAVQAAVLLLDEPAVQADPPHDEPVGPLQVLLAQLRGEQFVTDTFCSDRDYSELVKKQNDDEERKKERQADLDNIRRMIENI